LEEFSNSIRYYGMPKLFNVLEGHAETGRENLSSENYEQLYSAVEGAELKKKAEKDADLTEALMRCFHEDEIISDGPASELASNLYDLLK
jgi:hypothetical protein